MIFTHSKELEGLIADALRYRRLSTPRLKLGAVKIVVDGSIQGFTARLKWPGYYRGVDHGHWNVPPDELEALITRLNAAGVQIHVHVNGDEATEAALDAFDKALCEYPRRDHRHTLQHCQLADQAQYRRMRALGLCVNLFANHLYYFGDKHFETTVGPQRAQAMNACATALREGVPLAIHSDSPVTPLAPLTTAWCAANRLTETGRVLGPSERISAEEALRAITLGPAYTLHMDGEVGSIEVSKRADFAVLDQDPLAISPAAIKDIRVIGTVLDGVPTGPWAG
jgi:predicted amidohydrolase YtcJ